MTVAELKIETVPEIKRGKQCISDEQIQALSHYALDLEKYYGFPQDIEWAVGGDQTIYHIANPTSANAYLGTGLSASRHDLNSTTSFWIRERLHVREWESAMFSS